MLFIFDMDGTILDSMPSLTRSAVETISNIYSLSPEEAEEKYKSTVGLPFAQQLQVLFPMDTRNQEAVQIYERAHLDSASFFELSPGFVGELKRLQERGHKSALVTSTDLSILEFGMPQIVELPFDFMGGHTPSCSKPHQIDAAVKMFPNERSVMFGDSEFDRHCANDVGALFFLVTPQTIAEVMARFQ